MSGKSGIPDAPARLRARIARNLHKIDDAVVAPFLARIKGFKFRSADAKTQIAELGEWRKLAEGLTDPTLSTKVKADISSCICLCDHQKQAEARKGVVASCDMVVNTLMTSIEILQKMHFPARIRKLTFEWSYCVQPDPAVLRQLPFRKF